MTEENVYRGNKSSDKEDVYTIRLLFCPLLAIRNNTYIDFFNILDRLDAKAPSHVSLSVCLTQLTDPAAEETNY